MLAVVVLSVGSVEVALERDAAGLRPAPDELARAVEGFVRRRLLEVAGRCSSSLSGLPVVGLNAASPFMMRMRNGSLLVDRHPQRSQATRQWSVGCACSQTGSLPYTSE